MFDNISHFYNKLMYGVPYNFWVSYIEAIFKKLNIDPKTILDVACGTGTVSNILTERNYIVSGFDLSVGMIEQAKKSYPNIDFTIQNASNFKYNKKFDVAISLFDSLNYILNKNDLQCCFKQVYKHLNPKGAFIFDMNTIYALENNLFAQICLNEDANPKYIWVPKWDSINKTCTIDMKFIYKDQEFENTFHEVHIQKGYEIKEIENMLELAGFKVVNVYSAYRWTKPDRKTDRVFYICIKEG